MKTLQATFLALTLSLPMFAQTIELGMGYGYAHLTGPEQYVNPISNRGYGFTEAHPLLATVRFSRPNNPVALSVSGTYQRLSGRGAIYLIDYLENSNLLPGQIENDLSLWSVSFGGDWTPTSFHHSPHLSLELIFSSMGDLSTTTGYRGGDIHQLKTGSIQCGAAFGAGFNFPLAFGMAIRVDAKYILYGMFARPIGEKSLNSAQVGGTFVLPIWSSQVD